MVQWLRPLFQRILSVVVLGSLLRNTRLKLFWDNDVVLFAFREEAGARSSLRGGIRRRRKAIFCRIAMTQEQVHHCPNIRWPCRMLRRLPRHSLTPSTALCTRSSQRRIRRGTRVLRGEVLRERCGRFLSKSPPKVVRGSQCRERGLPDFCRWRHSRPMSRVARIIVPGFPHHVTQRGNCTSPPSPHPLLFLN